MILLLSVDRPGPVAAFRQWDVLPFKNSERWPYATSTVSRAKEDPHEHARTISMCDPSKARTASLVK